MKYLSGKMYEFPLAEGNSIQSSPFARTVKPVILSVSTFWGKPSNETLFVENFFQGEKFHP